MGDAAKIKAKRVSKKLKTDREGRAAYFEGPTEG
jgi:hypothetical protein